MLYGIFIVKYFKVDYFCLLVYHREDLNSKLPVHDIEPKAVGNKQPTWRKYKLGGSLYAITQTFCTLCRQNVTIYGAYTM